jgi:hypothetical protein
MSTKAASKPASPDQFDDLRVGDAADMGPQSEAAFAQDALYAILFMSFRRS